LADLERDLRYLAHGLVEAVFVQHFLVQLDLILPRAAGHIGPQDGDELIAAFEVEATTSIYSGLLRMSDLVALQPNTTIDLYIVAPDERRRKVRNEILRPTFESFEPPLRTRCRYLSVSSLDAVTERTRPPLNKHLQPTVMREFAEQVAFET
jgi:hypothetical protein